MAINFLNSQNIDGGITTNASSTIAGANVTSNFLFSDGIAANFGGDADLSIYSDNVNSNIESDNNTLFVIAQKQTSGSMTLMSTDSSSSTDSYILLNGSSKEVVINEDSKDIDFRVESNNLDDALFVQGSTGFVGLGTQSPSYTLDVESSENILASFVSTSDSGRFILADDDTTAYFGVKDSHLNIGLNSSITSNQNLEILLSNSKQYMAFGGSPGAANKFKVSRSESTDDDTNYAGIFSDLNLSGSSQVSGDRTYRGMYSDVDSSSTGGNTTDEIRLYGLEANVSDSGDADLIYGVYSYTRNNRSTAGDNTTNLIAGRMQAVGALTAGTVTNCIGVHGSAQADNAGGTINGLYGGLFQTLMTTDSDKVVPNAYGVSAKVDTGTGGGGGIFSAADGGRFEVEMEVSGTTMTNARAVHGIIDLNNGTITNAYQFYGQTTKAGGTTVTNNYGIYTLGCDKNFLTGTLEVTTINEVGSDTDKFLMSDGGEVKFVTGANLLSYIGAGTGSMSGFGVASAVGGSSFTISNGETLSIVGGTNIASAINTTDESITLNYDGPLPAITTNGSTPSLASGITATEVRTLIGAGTSSSSGVTSVDTSAPITGGTITGTGTIGITQAGSGSDGYLSSTDWNTFNNKTSNTGTVTGTGVSGRVAYWNGTSSITSDTDLTFDGSNLTIGGDLTVTGGDITSKGENVMSNSASQSHLLIGDTQETDGISLISFKAAGSTQAQVDDGQVNLQSNVDLLMQGGNVRLTGNSNVILDPSLSSQQSSGTILPIGSNSVTAGKLYYWAGLSWTTTNANNESDSKGLLAYAISTGTASANRMVVNGMIYKASHGFIIGSPLYISTTAGNMQATAPSGNNDCARVVGYATDSNHIYFNPDNTWVKVST